MTLSDDFSERYIQRAISLFQYEEFRAELGESTEEEIAHEAAVYAEFAEIIVEQDPTTPEYDW